MPNKFTKEELEDMSIDELQKIAGSKEVSKEKLIAKILPKAKQ